MLVASNLRYIRFTLIICIKNIIYNRDIKKKVYLPTKKRTKLKW